MTPAPLSKVIRVVAKATSKDPVANREEIVDLINGTIDMLYRTESLVWLYFKSDGCAIAEAFNENCRTGPCTSFTGVVMPAQLQNIRELHTDGYKYEITAKRVGLDYPVGRDYQMGRAYPAGFDYPIGRGCELKAEHLPPRLLARDIPACNDSRVVTFRSDSDEDCGKLIGVRYYDLNNREQRIDIVLGPGRVSTGTSVGEFVEIVFPERCGWITVETDNGTELGRYHPSILTPVHEWFRLQGTCAGRKVHYYGLREPMPLVFDTDLVPFSDNTLWRLALKAYEHVDTLELTPGQQQGLNRIYASLAAVTAADQRNDNMNFNTLLMPESGRTMLSTGRAMMRGTKRYVRY
mgnify:CR=1 FL=1|jgi:hypothetical protein